MSFRVSCEDRRDGPPRCDSRRATKETTEQRAAAGRTLDLEPPERHQPVGDPHQAVPARIGASDPVVANGGVEHPVLHGCRDLGVAGMGVLDHVGERLGHEEVRARLDLVPEPHARNIDVNRQVEPAAGHPKRSP
ncbi:hypothetical protein [Candidatus Solirubrobacter pratensis]|uniref:hypothetical protein n=1 Tax=Candidatus Solirubrobacter pratensis TaxID=1298857 RepID=UPI0012DC1930|nr:hypothetical protein [Candidatus Solirubrobacter pratensis]